MSEKINLIPIDQIRILNPRSRNRKKFEELVQNIKKLGLKKPILVSLRGAKEPEGPGYDLIFGQGRIEAFRVLGYTEIAAIVVKITKQECLLRRLVENMARKFTGPEDLLLEITRLKSRGNSSVEIGRMLDLTETQMRGILALQRAGEECLLRAVLSGRVRISIAMEIARTKDLADQRALLKAYKKQRINGNSLGFIKRLIARRRLLGRRGKRPRTRLDRSVVNAFTLERDRLKGLISKAKVCGTKLTFLANAFRQLLDDENFTNLLRAESLVTMPKNLWSKLPQSQNKS